MTTFEDVARQKLTLAVDNTEHRQMPLPVPWYERWFYLGALAMAALFGAYCMALILFSVE